MIDILHRIASWKRSETDIRKQTTSIASLQDNSLYHSECYSLSKTLINSTTPQFIAEFKRKSPSKGIIKDPASPEDITKAYQNAGAAAVSVLTDENFFGAHEKDFSIARSSITIPILRKDFIIDPYQIHESKAIGADIILLIAAILSPDQVNEYASLAKQLGMEVLLEIHTQDELNRISESIDIIGINNRNLKNFEVDIENSKNLIYHLPNNLPKVAESGLSSPDTVIDLFENGFSGFLIGESFMREGNPGSACQEMINSSQKPFL